MTSTTNSRRVKLGTTVITRGANETLIPEDMLHAVSRHERCDWGDICEEDRRANDEALVEGTRLLSAYRDGNGTRFWVITEADRSATTVLLPDEY